MKVQPQDGDAIKMVVRMDALFLVDREARKQGMTAAERLAFRREHALEWVDEIQQALAGRCSRLCASRRPLHPFSFMSGNPSTIPRLLVLER